MYFQLIDEESALKTLDEVGLMFPHEAQLSRKSYYEKHKNQKIGTLPYGYRLAVYFLIDNGYAEAVLWKRIKGGWFVIRKIIKLLTWEESCIS